MHPGPRFGGLSGAVTAWRTLTALPIPGPEGGLAASLPWFPLVGAALGALLFAAGKGLSLCAFGDWTVGIALLLTAGEVLLTRGLHLDGLADWADSIGGNKDRERRLAIMRDSSLGAFGGLALVLSVGARIILYQRLLASGTLLCLLPVLAVSRHALVVLLTTMPYARTGPGMARAFVEGASSPHRVLSLAAALLVCLPFGPTGMGMLVMAEGLALFLRRRWLRVFGGITGDLLGTAEEIIAFLLLLLCGLGGPWLQGVMAWTPV